MAKKMLIDATHAEETRVVVVDGNKVDEFDFETSSKRQLAGNIYLAKVTRVEPSLQAAFVDYGGNRHGFLAFSEIHPDYYQIPVADRQALLAEEKAIAQSEDDDDSDEPKKSSRSRRRSSRSRQKDTGEAKKPEQAPATSLEGVEGMDVVDFDDEDSSEGAAKSPFVIEDSHGSARKDAGETAPAGAEETAPAEQQDAAPAAESAAPMSEAGGKEDVPAAEASEVSEAPEGETPEAAQTDASEETPEASSEDDAEADAPRRPIAARNEDRQDDVLSSGEVDAAGDVAPEADGPVGETGEGDPSPETAAEDEASAEESNDAGEDEASEEAGDGDDDDDNGHDPASEIESVAEEDVQEEIQRPRKPRMRRYKIQEVIKVRQIMLVQVVKEERGNKGAALTTYLSLAGRYCVLMPNTARGGGISRKITNSVDRKKLKEIASEIDVPEGAGLIIRTAGAKRTKSEIKRDYEYLKRLWEQIRALTLKSIAPAPIYEEGNLIKRSIRDLYNRDIDEVFVEGDEGYRVAKDFMKMIMPSHAKNVKHYQDQMPLFARYQVESYLAAMFNPVVQLKSGGYIVIGVTEALVAIDVNSGRATKEGSIEETALKTNLEAAEEVARQLRLRDLAGLIVIDFIDMEERKNNAAVEKRFKEKLKTDRARIQVGRISGFGLLEMSRQRLRPGMLEATTQPCPHCHGTGLLRSSDSIGLQILRQLEEEGGRKRSREVLVKVPPAICNFLINQKRERIAHIEAIYGMAVRLEADPALIPPDFTMEKFKTATRAVPEPSSAVVSVDISDMPEIEDAEEEAVEVEAEATEAEATPTETEDTDAPKKKRRRRRRRRGSSGQDNGENQQSGDDDSSSDDTQSDETTPEAVEESTGEPSSEESGKEQKPSRSRRRSRSRSRKSEDESAAVPETASGDAEAASGDGAGAPAEPTAEAAASPESAGEETPVAAASAELPSVEEAAAVEPAEPVEEAAPVEAAAPDEAQTPVEVTPAEPEQEPMLAAEEPEAAEGAVEPAPEASGTAAPETKAAESAAPEAVEAPAQEPELAEALEAESADDEPSKPKRRGWWSVGR
ncbi:Rne/Rng family ribonuclease [Tropicimonas isoalkanivorans]|uniref:Ribonuclease E n=1 Tax=Tropicimonas isoalkanivorans TaxID=441112 RepID=A0A1I1DCP1_9RHOB|nr:Rne/Rng family ribonuclease [Tropicimonas isoalkanivorans]SFB70570.1 RNAse E [Tropicimonas isoalkanivorans]